MNSKVLNWEGPIKFDKDNYKKDLKDIKFDKSGVYIWTYEINKIHYVHYIGETSGTFRQRFEEHFTPMLSGESWIYDFNCLQRLVCDIKVDGKKVNDFFRTDKFKDYQDKRKDELGADYLSNLNFFICPLEEDIKNIEEYLIYKVALNEGISSKLFFINKVKNCREVANEYFLKEHTIYENQFKNGVQVDVLNI